jgi:hypothetical protein
MQTCLSALYDRWVTAKGNNKMEAQRLGNVILEILTLWQEYESAQRNGEDYSIKAGEIAVLLSKEGFSCTYENDGESVVVVPWGQALGGGGVGAAIYLVTAVPTGGNSGDWAIGKPGSVVGYYLYYNNGGVWEYQGSIKGSDGAAGDSYEPVLSQSIVTVGAKVQSGWQILKIYTLEAGELADDDDLEIEALFEYDPPIEIDDSIIGLWIGAQPLITKYFGSTPAGNSHYTLHARLVRTGTTTAYETIYMIASDRDPMEIWDVSRGALTGLNFGADQSISAQCSKSGGAMGALNDIKCHYLRIKKNVKRTEGAPD